MRSWLQ
jgi:hypothetical protein